MMISTWTCAAFALLLAAPVPASNAQESGHPQALSIPHRLPDAMSPADRAALDSRQRELVETARIYGYNLEAGNWSYEQALCGPMPQTIMLHYFQDLPNGTESIFTALVPRAKGRVRIVPVLYRNATPFLPAPRNPHNYALFNDLVPSDIARREAGGGVNWLELSACYAELTGVPTNLPSSANADIGIAGAPSATVHVDVQEKSTRVTLANREGEHTYKVWSIAFNHDGRVTAAATEDRSVLAGNQPAGTTAESPQSVSPHAAAEVTNLPAEKSVRPAPQSTAGIASSQAPPAASSSSFPQSAAATSTSSVQSAIGASSSPAFASVAEPPSEPGWKYILHPAEPSSKIIPQAPPPRETVKPEPPDAAGQSASENQAPQ